MGHETEVSSKGGSMGGGISLGTLLLIIPIVVLLF
jgi:hypothetical protein